MKFTDFVVLELQKSRSGEKEISAENAAAPSGISSVKVLYFSCNSERLCIY